MRCYSILLIPVLLMPFTAQAQELTSADAYSQRGIARFEKNDLDGAIAVPFTFEHLRLGIGDEDPYSGQRLRRRPLVRGHPGRIMDVLGHHDITLRHRRLLSEPG